MLRTRFGTIALVTAAGSLGTSFIAASPAAAVGETVSVFISSQNGTYANSQQASLTIAAPTNATTPRFEVDLSKTYQTIDGMGTALDLTSITNLWQMTASNRSAVLTKLFGANQANISVLRIQFGTSDFNGVALDYTYDDMPAGQTDPTLANFSIQKDIDNHIIDVLQEALDIRPDLKIYAGVWSPPAWMKDSDRLRPRYGAGTQDGYMLSQYVDEYATYLRKAVQAYEAEGIPIWALTPQNEPDYCNNTYMQACWGADTLKAAVNALDSEFTTHGIDTQIWLGEAGFAYYDSLYGDALNDSSTLAKVDGIAFHPYEGQPSSMNKAAYERSRPVYMTEQSQNYIEGPLDFTSHFRNSAGFHGWWVSIANEKGGPSNGPFGESSCYSGGPCYFGGSDPGTLVQTNSTNYNSFRYTYSYEFVKQFSAYAKPGATRVWSDEGTSTLKTVAFRNPDGQAVVVVTNSASSTQSFRLATPTGDISATLPALSVGTYTWYPQNLAQNPGFESNFTSWSVDAGSAGSETSYPHSGSRDGYLHPTGGAAAKLSQTFTAPSNGYYTVDAWAATSSNSVLATLAADVNGVQKATAVAAGGVYRPYRLTFRANAGDTVKVSYGTAAGATTWATIDDVYITRGSPNLLNNPGFEVNSLAGWVGSANSGVEMSYPSSGGYDAYVHPVPSASGGLTQTLTAPATGTYTFTAYSATNIGSGVYIGADVAGSSAASTSVSGSGLSKYTVTFSATAGQAIQVWLYAPAGSATNWVVLDDASLRVS